MNAVAAIKPLIVSASQVETFRLCKRKWWLEKVAAAPTQDKGYFDFGTVLHAVCERYLGADDRGLDPATGQPVELYPEGWHIAPDTGVAMDADQQALIKTLIAEAIDRGVLQRLEGREVEAHFTRPLLGLQDGEGQPVQITGYIDYLLPDQVQDHKTVGSWRYAKSGEALQGDAQMLIYAWELSNRLKERGLPVPERILVRHNQFGKDPLAPRLSTAIGWVTQAEIDAEMQTVRSDALGMLATRQIESWIEVPESSKSGACRKYRGCDFQRICLGEHDLAQHHDLTTRLNRDRLATRASHQHGDSAIMGNALTALLEKRTAAAGGSIPPATGPAPELNSGLSTAAPTAAPAAAFPHDKMIGAGASGAPKTAPAAASALPQETAPWYDEGCPACSKNAQRGVKSNGKMACMVCDGQRRKKGLSTSADYLTEPGDVAGRLKWTELKKLAQAPAIVTGEPAVAAPVVVAAPVRQTASVAPVAAVAAPAAAPTAPVQFVGQGIEVMQPEDDEPASVATPAQPQLESAKRGPGRPKKGIMLLIGCARVTGGAKPFLLSKIVNEAIDAIEKDPSNGNKSFWSLDTWKRKDAVCSFARGFALQNPGIELVCDDMRLPEAGYFLNVLRGLPEVTDIIQATAQ